MLECPRQFSQNKEERYSRVPRLSDTRYSMIVEVLDYSVLSGFILNEALQTR